jgi:hypothetical protein
MARGVRPGSSALPVMVKVLPEPVCTSRIRRVGSDKWGQTLSLQFVGVSYAIVE